MDSVNAGLTMEMPNGYFYADFLSQAVAAGQVSHGARIDTMVSRVLTQMFAFGLFDKAPSGSPTATVTTAAHAQVALQGAEEGTVLLKNNGILPLSTSSLSSIAVIGVDGGAGTQTIGGGSATVTSPGTVWPLTGIQNRVAGTGRHGHLQRRHATRRPRWPSRRVPASRSSSPATTTATRSTTPPRSTCRTARTR